jgi:prophage DNA circulation protein
VTDCIAPVYLDASWKGVPFFVENSADEFGRRGDLYEYPLSDDIGYKDLGRKARRFKVEGYLIGTDQVGLTQEMASATGRMRLADHQRRLSQGQEAHQAGV